MRRLKLKWLGRGGIVLVALLVGQGLSEAQTQCSANCTVEVGKGFTAQWDPPTNAAAVPVDGYKVYLDGVQQGANIVAVPGTNQLTNITVSARGAHTLEVSAYNADREGPKAQVQLNAVLAAPGVPSNFRIVITAAIAANGQVEWRIASIEQVKDAPQPE